MLTSRTKVYTSVYDYIHIANILFVVSYVFEQFHVVARDRSRAPASI